MKQFKSLMELTRAAGSKKNVVHVALRQGRRFLLEFQKIIDYLGSNWDERSSQILLEFRSGSAVMQVRRRWVVGWSVL